MHLQLWAPKIACNNLSVADVRTLTPSLRAAHDKALAAGMTVPTSVSNSLLRLEGAAGALDGATVEESTAAPEVSVARVALASAWRGVFGQLELWEKIDRPSGATAAATLRGKVFPRSKPLAFLTGKTRAVWLRSGELLDLFRAHGGVRLFESRASAAAYQQLLDAHEACRRAIGLSGSLRPARIRVNQRDVLQEVVPALTDYVTRVHTITCPSCPGTEDITAKLLAPLAAVAPVRLGGTGGKNAKKTDAPADGKATTPRAAKKKVSAPKDAVAAPTEAEKLADAPIAAANDAAPQAIAS
jgi:hypothetical protein